MSTNDQYTPDELAFLDKALVGIANAVFSDPDVVSLNAAGLAKDALVLLDARRKIRGPAKALDDAGARRLERLDPFYAAASRLVNLLGDGDAMYTNQVLAHLDSHVATMKDRGSRLTNMSLANDALKKRVKELESQRAATPAAPIANDEPVCNENMIRGAYFSAGEVRGGIAFNGTTMGLEYIPEQLGLNTGDIVEIRVIERADR